MTRRQEKQYEWSAVNLHGVGLGATLTVLDVSRLPKATGSQRNFVDISGLTLSAIERIDIQTDSAAESMRFR